MTILSKSNYIDALHGKGGGYRLNCSPKEYRVGDILRVVLEDIVIPKEPIIKYSSSIILSILPKWFQIWQSGE